MTNVSTSSSNFWVENDPPNSYYVTSTVTGTDTATEFGTSLFSVHLHQKPTSKITVRTSISRRRRAWSCDFKENWEALISSQEVLNSSQKWPALAISIKLPKFLFHYSWWLTDFSIYKHYFFIAEYWARECYANLSLRAETCRWGHNSANFP